jgi:hypothetical protein
MFNTTKCVTADTEPSPEPIDYLNVTREVWRMAGKGIKTIGKYVN